MSILNTIKPGDCVDFGYEGFGYIVGENPEGTAFYVTIEEKERRNPRASGWYVSKNLADRIIEEYEG